jgi:hypothetical protein
MDNIVTSLLESVNNAANRLNHLVILATLNTPCFFRKQLAEYAKVEEELYAITAMMDHWNSDEIERYEELQLKSELLVINGRSNKPCNLCIACQKSD